MKPAPVVSPIVVTITANNTPGQLTVTSGTPVLIKWTVENAQPGDVCVCKYGNGQSCGPNSSGPGRFTGDTLTPTTQTTYTVECP